MFAGAALIAACSGPGTPSNDEAETDMLAYSRCMRDNGISNFPDPNPDGGLTIDTAPGTGIEEDSAKFLAAEEACAPLLPYQVSPEQQTEQREAELDYAVCMRENGVENFPDPPTGNGPHFESTTTLDGSSNIDPNDPTVQTAHETCRHLRADLPDADDGSSSGNPDSP